MTKRPASPQSAPVPPAAPSAADPTFKMLYVLAIIMIVDGHVGSSDYLDFNGLLRYQNYHIALFMFVSGYFLNLTRGYKEFFARKTLRLLVPLYLWNAAYGALCWYLNRHQGFALGGEFNLYNLLYAPLVDGHQFIYNMASWFLVPLFLVQAVGYLLLRPVPPPHRLNPVCPAAARQFFPARRYIFRPVAGARLLCPGVRPRKPRRPHPGTDRSAHALLHARFCIRLSLPARPRQIRYCRHAALPVYRSRRPDLPDPKIPRL